MTEDVSKLITVSKMAVMAGMKVVSKYQLFGVPETKIKQEDQTVVTIVDVESGEKMRNSFQTHLPGVALNIEDVGRSRKGEIIGLGDPLDGTGAFANGLATSTVIMGCYDTEKEKVVSCVIGEPATGRVWSATQDIETILEIIDEHGSLHTKQTHVWSGELSKQSTVFVDVFRGFNRKERKILTDEQTKNLFSSLMGKTLVLMPGSNGLHQSLVANGGEGVAGSITLAVGGPWDVCGVLLVLQAGGAARALEMTSERKLTEKDPLDVPSYDLLITGNNQTTVNRLSDLLFTSIKD